MNEVNHTFAVCAYKENPYLEECVRSVTSQTVKSNVIIVTGTPNEYISGIAEKYGIPVIVNTTEDAQTGPGNLSFGYRAADTDYVTIVHQDDYYCPEFAETVLKRAEGRKPIILFTDYFELRNDQRVYKNKMMKVKALMNTGFRMFPSSRFVRKRVLSLGDPICCPSVTFYKPTCGDFSFCGEFINNVDWDAWIRLADKKGQFISIHKQLMGHRIHEESDTSKYIANGMRHDETLLMFKRFWPDWIARRILKLYESSDKSNILQEDK